MRDLSILRRKYAFLDMPEAVIAEIEHPPQSPQECIFARTTATFSADLKTAISPCQFGGDPDCSRCGCIASLGLAAVGHHKVLGPLTAGHLFMASAKVGAQWNRIMRKPLPDYEEISPFQII